MKHHFYHPGFPFVREPEEFDKNTDRELLQYCPGAAMYMPGTKDFSEKIIRCGMPGLTTMVMCFEDACPEGEVEAAEANVHRLLERVADAVENGELEAGRVPLIFCRVRNLEQFRRFADGLTPKQAHILAGINFPKFSSDNAEPYLRFLKELNGRYGERLYGMPILEEEKAAYRESRIPELLAIKDILDAYRELILQVRVGATDFSSCFGVRRGVDYSIYDILTVRECLSDIMNVLGRQNQYVISGPVWEYFRANKQMMFQELPRHGLEDCLLKRVPIVNHEVDGLLREVILDKANGFVGRTVIHPTHVKYVNALQAVTQEEYEDACQILAAPSGGVAKGKGKNRMNEMKPHTNWAKKVVMRARAFGVVENEGSYIRLFSVEEGRQ